MINFCTKKKESSIHSYIKILIYIYKVLEFASELNLARKGGTVVNKLFDRSLRQKFDKNHVSM